MVAERKCLDRVESHKPRMKKVAKRKGPFRLLGTREVYKNPWIQVQEDHVIRPDGKRGIFGFTSAHPGVSIVAIDKQGYCCLIKEYGYAIGRATIKLMAGAIDRGETPLQAAKRECLEESCMGGGTWRYLGNIHYYPTIFKTKEHLYLALGVEKRQAQSEEEKSLIQVIRIPFQKTVHMALTGKIDGAESIAAILKADYYLRSQKMRLGKN